MNFPLVVALTGQSAVSAQRKHDLEKSRPGFIRGSIPALPKDHAQNVS